MEENAASDLLPISILEYLRYSKSDQLIGGFDWIFTQGKLPYPEFGPHSRRYHLPEAST
jgi:hypothetical protein